MAGTRAVATSTEKPTEAFFAAVYRCYPISMRSGNPLLDHGDKAILPAAALDRLARMRVTYPMMFRFETRSGPRQLGYCTHGGVLEFSAEVEHACQSAWQLHNWTS